MANIDSDDFGGFNSDDFEDVMPAAAPKLNPRAGWTSRELYIQNAVSDRVKSKAVVRTLQFGYGAPSTIQHQSLWVARFETWRETLRQNIDTPFVADDIVRFFATTLDGKMRVFHGKSSIGVDTFVSATAILMQYGWSKWSRARGFDIGPELGVKLKCWIHDMVQQQRLMRGRWQAKTFISYTVLSQLGRTYLEHHIKHGTRSWDIIIARTLGVVLVASLAARSGDVARSKLYASSEYVQYRHIRLFIDGDAATFANLRAEVILAFRKGEKDKHNSGTTSYLRPLNEAHNTHMCPIALLMVHALRHSLVEGRDLQDILDRAFARSDRRVVWLYPQRPVIVAFGGKGLLQLDKPASAGQACDTLKAMALIGGMLDRAYTHALRSGAARDLAHLKHAAFDGSGMANSNVRQSLSHTHAAYTSGVTEGYTGGSTSEHWSLRAAQSKLHRREPGFAKASAAQPLDVVKAKVTDAEVQEMIARYPNGLTKGHAVDLVRDERLRKLRDTAERQDHTHTMTRLTEPSPLPASTTIANRARVPLAEKDVNGRPSLPTPTTDRELYANIDPEILSEQEIAAMAAAMPDTNATQIYNDAIPTQSDADTPSDIAEITQEEAALKRLHDANAANPLTALDEHMERAAAALFCDDAPKANATDQVAQWIAAYAEVNVVKDSAFALLWVKHCQKAIPQGQAFKDIFTPNSWPNGGSRGQPRPFMLRCRKTEACLFKHPILSELEAHERLCTVEVAALLKAAVDARAVEPLVKCPYNGCGFAPKSNHVRGPEYGLKRHIATMHTYVPKVCPHGCDPETFYTTKRTYDYHLAKEHTDGWPRACSHADCSSSPPVYGSRSALKKHLEKKHEVFGDDIEAFMPPTAKKHACVGTRLISTRSVQNALGFAEADNSGYATSDASMTLLPNPGAA